VDDARRRMQPERIFLTSRARAHVSVRVCVRTYVHWTFIFRRAIPECIIPAASAVTCDTEQIRRPIGESVDISGPILDNLLPDIYEIQRRHGVHNRS